MNASYGVATSLTPSVKVDIFERYHKMLVVGISAWPGCPRLFVGIDVVGRNKCLLLFRPTTSEKVPKVGASAFCTAPGNQESSSFNHFENVVTLTFMRPAASLRVIAP